MKFLIFKEVENVCRLEEKAIRFLSVGGNCDRKSFWIKNLSIDFVFEANERSWFSKAGGECGKGNEAEKENNRKSSLKKDPLQ